MITPFADRLKSSLIRESGEVIETFCWAKAIEIKQDKIRVKKNNFRVFIYAIYMISYELWLSPAAKYIRNMIFRFVNFRLESFLFDKQRDGEDV